MKLLRYGPAGQEKPGMLDRDGKIRDLSGVVSDINGAALAPASLEKLRGIEDRCDPRRLLPGARSALVVGWRYAPLVGEPEPAGDLWPGVARYARWQAAAAHDGKAPAPCAPSRHASAAAWWTNEG